MSKIPAAQVALLREQARHMHNLEGVLRHRLELIDDEQPKVSGGA